MGFGIYKQLVVLTLVLCLAAANGNHYQNFQPQNSTIEGRVHWTYVYDRDSLIYYIVPNLTASQGSPFSFDVPVNSGEIQLVLTKHYVTVDINTSKLGTVDLPSGNTTFNFIPYASEQNTFYLVHNATNQVIITPNNRPPFSFYIQSRYPDISEPALFKFTPADFFLEEMYDGQRNNTRKTLEAIHNITDGSMEDYYNQFLNLTRSYSHWIGKEIFLIASYIKEDLGIDSTPFQLLPTQIRLIFSGPCRLILKHWIGLNYLMVNSTYTLTDELAYPYTFTFDKSGSSSTGWFQVQINNRQNTLWSNNGSNNTLNHTIGSGNEFRFQFHLQSFYRTFEIHTEQNPPSNAGRLYCRYSNPRVIYTVGPNSSYIADFTVEQYYVNVDKLYSRKRENIFDTIHLIKEFSSSNNSQRSNYQTLLDGMYSAGHHLNGSEIFCIGLSIQQDLPDSDLLERLPPQVQMLLLQDKMYELYLFRNGSMFPFKYAYASDLHENIETYSIEFGPDFYNPVVSISYGNSRNYQWDLDEERSLIDVLSTERRLKFRISRDSDGFQLLTIEPFYFLRTKSSAPDFYFYGSEEGFVNGYRFMIIETTTKPTTPEQTEPTTPDPEETTTEISTFEPN